MISLSRLVGRLSFSGKFFLIGSMFFIPVAVLLFMIARNSLLQIATIDHELEGLRVNDRLRTVLQQVQLHRGLTNSFLSGNSSLEPKIQEANKHLDGLLADKSVAATLQSLGVGAEWSQFESGWLQVRDNWRNQSAPDNLKAHSGLVAQLLHLSDRVVDRSELSLDPESESYHLQNLLFERLLPVTEQLALARGFGAGVATRQQITQ